MPLEKLLHEAGVLSLFEARRQLMSLRRRLSHSIKYPAAQNAASRPPTTSNTHEEPKSAMFSPAARLGRGNIGRGGASTRATSYRIRHRRQIATLVPPRFAAAAASLISSPLTVCSAVSSTRPALR